MEKEGAINQNSNDKQIELPRIKQQLGDLEGKKCRAPHTHQWGSTVYHNAMICSVFEDNCDIKVSRYFLTIHIA